mmetsp:Transcript_46930/g.54844  ORF Transcript_46930/g.54844 Transcript_46930/m.54844 type:complete len:82 (-) Transcript_46930:84-329(-)
MFKTLVTTSFISMFETPLPSPPSPPLLSKFPAEHCCFNTYTHTNPTLWRHARPFPDKIFPDAGAFAYDLGLYRGGFQEQVF